MPAMPLHNPLRTPLSGIAVLYASIGLLAGCGGSSAPKAPTQQGRPTPAQSSPDVGGTGAQAGHDQRATSGSGLALAASSSRAQNRAPAGPSAGAPTRGRAGGVQRARSTPATSNDDLGKPARTKFNPCSLVSASEAQAITGAALTGRFEAPLGPTCVYKLGGSKGEITLAVEALSLSEVAHQMVKPQTLVVGHRHAYCGRLGTQMLLAPVGRGRLLNVTAPCAIAQRFAALALTRLAA